MQRGAPHPGPERAGTGARNGRGALADWAENSVVLYRDDWHLGVIGIVASRMVERFHRPSVMMCRAASGLVKGSARSVGGISIHAALTMCSDLLEEFGGHDFAAGMTIREENVEAFKRRFDAAVGEVAAAGALVPTYDVDAVLDLDDITGRFWAVLRQFAPHGPENHTPLSPHSRTSRSSAGRSRSGATGSTSNATCGSAAARTSSRSSATASATAWPTSRTRCAAARRSNCSATSRRTSSAASARSSSKSKTSAPV